MAYIFDLFGYSNYADFLANGGWTELVGPTNASITFPPFTHTTHAGDNEQATYQRNIGSWTDDATVSPGTAAFILVGNFDNPMPSNGVGCGITLVDDAFTNGLGMNFAANYDGTWSFLGIATWATSGTEYVSGITGFEDATGYVLYMSMNTSTRVANISLYNQSFSLIHSWTPAEPMPDSLVTSIALFNIAASPISFPSEYTVTASQLVITYTSGGGGGSSWTTYTPNITGSLGNNQTNFARRR